MVQNMEKSFHDLKDALTSALLLTLPEGTNGLLFILMFLELGWDVFSLMKNGKVIAYDSRQLKFMTRTILSRSCISGGCIRLNYLEALFVCCPCLYFHRPQEFGMCFPKKI